MTRPQFRAVLALSAGCLLLNACLFRKGSQTVAQGTQKASQASDRVDAAKDAADRVEAAKTTADKVIANIPPIRGKAVEAFALRYIDTRIGTGAMLRPRTCLFVHYTGWLTNGTKFDSSRDSTTNGQPRPPLSFAQGARRVVIGWDVGFEGMKVGGQRRLFIPYQLGYGETGRLPTIPPKSELIFDVELVAVADTLPPRTPAVRGQPAPPTLCPTWDVVKIAAP